MKKFFDGIKIGLGIIFSFSILFSLVYAIGFHNANEILGGTFLGDYKFSGKVEIGDLKLNHSNLVCDLTREGNIRYNGTSFQGCNGSNWNVLSEDVSIALSEVEVPNNEGTLVYGTAYARAGNDYDGSGEDKSYASCAIYSGTTAGPNAYAGKQWASSKLVKKAIIISSNDYGFQYDGATIADSWTFYLEGSDDGSSWTIINTQFFTNSGAKHTITLENVDYNTKHLYHRIRGVKGGANVGNLMTLAKTTFYEMK